MLDMEKPSEISEKSYNMTYDIFEEDFKEVIVIGGGTCGLSVAARLCESFPGVLYTEDEHQRFHWLKKREKNVSLLDKAKSNKLDVNSRRVFKSSKVFSSSEILVLDETSDKFLGKWDNQFESCKIPFLRSPMFFHCDPVNIDGMVSYAHYSGREKEIDLKKIDNVLGKEYSKHQMKRNMKKKKKTVPVPNGIHTHDRNFLIDTNMRDWRDYYRPSTSLFRDYCEDVIERYNLKNCIQKESVTSLTYTDLNILESNQSGKGLLVQTSSGKILGCKICILCAGHKGKAEYPIQNMDNQAFLDGSCHTSHIFDRAVEFPHPRLITKVNKSEKTTLIVVGGGLTSAQLVDVAIKSGISKVHFVLRGPIKIKHFDFHLDWVTKYKNVKKSAFYILDSDEERAQMIKDAREGGSINPEYYKKLQLHIKTGRLVLHEYSKIISSLWKRDEKNWEVKLEKTDGSGSTQHLCSVDYICLATGINADFDNLPFLQNLFRDSRINTIKGFPCLTENLQWNDEVPLFVSGKYASLRIGPTSANLDGARSGAERIGWYIQDLKSRGKLDWQEDYWEEEPSKTGSEIGVKKYSSSLETKLKLAGGEISWFSLLSEA